MKIRFAHKPMKISITQKDINRAKKLLQSGKSFTYANNCPIALAVKRKTHKRVSVFPAKIQVWRDWEEATYYFLPEKAQKFITAFDCRYPVKPFTFETS